MSAFELNDIGGGKFAVTGDVTFKTAGDILKASETPFDKHTQIEIDLSGVAATDSAGLALLLEWITWANHTVREIRFIGVPAKIEAIAKVTEVEELLSRGERWSGFIDAPSSNDG